MIIEEAQKSDDKANSKFKPCPFCGNKDIAIQKVSHNGGFGEGYENWLIKCNVCFAEMNIPADNFYEREYYTEEEAIAMWNYRDKEVEDESNNS